MAAGREGVGDGIILADGACPFSLLAAHHGFERREEEDKARGFDCAASRTEKGRERMRSGLVWWKRKSQRR